MRRKQSNRMRIIQFKSTKRLNSGETEIGFEHFGIHWILACKRILLMRTENRCQNVQMQCHCTQFIFISNEYPILCVHLPICKIHWQLNFFVVSHPMMHNLMIIYVIISLAWPILWECFSSSFFFSNDLNNCKFFFRWKRQNQTNDKEQCSTFCLGNKSITNIWLMLIFRRSELNAGNRVWCKSDRMVFEKCELQLKRWVSSNWNWIV